MIFSNKISKISSGKNLSMYATNSGEMELYLFNKKVQKKIITFSNIVKCSSTNNNYSYNHITKLNDNFLCACFDDNMSVIKNDEK